MTNNKYNVDIDKLTTLNLFQLREVGSKVGVRNPTALKADELREAIIKVVTGQVEPYLKIKSGRPHRKQIIADEDWNKLVGFDNDLNQTFGINQNVTGALYSVEGSILEQSANEVYRGYVKFLGNSAYFFTDIFQNYDLNKYAVVSNNINYFNFLRSGDEISCNIDFTASVPKVIKIITINGFEPMELNRSNFDSIEPEAMLKPINFTLPQLKFINTVCPIKLGQRMIIKGPSGSGQTYLANSIAKDLEEKYSVVYFAVCKRPEDKVNLKACEYFFTTFDTIPRDIIFFFEFILDRIKRLCEFGQNVVFIIDDIISLMLNLRNLVAERHKNVETYYGEILQQIKKLFALSKYSSKGSLTIICTSFTDSIVSQFNEFVVDLDKLCNCHIGLNRQAFNQGNLEFYDKNETYAETIRQI